MRFGGFEKNAFLGQNLHFFDFLPFFEFSQFFYVLAIFHFFTIFHVKSRKSVNYDFLGTKPDFCC
jgi:hypothetical protein